MKNLLCTLALTAAFTVGSPSLKADMLTFSAVLTGDQEPTDSPGIGVGIVILDTDTNTITAALNFTGLQANATAAHIHRGAVGISGPIVVRPWMDAEVPNATAGFLPINTVGAPDDVVSDLQSCALDSGNCNLYFNIHNSAHPGGEIRGQIYPVQ